MSRQLPYNTTWPMVSGRGRQGARRGAPAPMGRPAGVERPVVARRGAPAPMGRPAGEERPVVARRGDPVPMGRPAGVERPVVARRGDPAPMGRPAGVERPVVARRGAPAPMGRPAGEERPVVARRGDPVPMGRPAVAARPVRAPRVAPAPRGRPAPAGQPVVARGVRSHVATRGINRASARLARIQTPSPVRPQPQVSSPAENYFMCPICFHNIRPLILLAPECGHAFCRNCLRAAFAQRPYCPICEQQIHEELFRYIYL